MNVLGNRQRPLLIAHRGAPVHAPENTFASFQLAIDSGADIMETDLWFTRDGVIVCHHDDTVDRVTDGSGTLPEMTLDEVKKAYRRLALKYQSPGWMSFSVVIQPSGLSDHWVGSMETTRSISR